jgi:c-di-GMP-binding flagellar brake protein YcgR
MNAELLAQSVTTRDLSFLRFPQGSPEAAAQVVGVIVVVLFTVTITLSAQRWYQRWTDRRPKKGAEHVKAGPKLNPRQQAALDLLRFYTDPLKLKHLLDDARVFESSVENALPTASEEDLADITALRRHLRMTVMNPDLQIVSTRQLLEDLPVRIIAAAGEDRLDLYCTVLQINEHFLLIDLPYQEEIYRLLMEHPAVHLVYWREESGEAMFDVTLEPIQQGTLSAFRVHHAVLAEDAAHRADFRLTVDLPVHYACVPREQLVRRKETGVQFTAIQGEGRLIDLSDGGGALVAPDALPVQGIAQLTFTLEDKPLRMMLELLTVTPGEGGHHVARGRFRGANPDSRSRLQAYLSREQFNRLRNKESILTKVAG